MRIVAKRKEFHTVSMSTENITHVRYAIYSKRTSIALLQYYSDFALSTGPDKVAELIFLRVTVKSENEPTHEILALFVFHKVILHTRMQSHPVELAI